MTNQPGSGNDSESYSTSFSMRRFTVTGNYTQANGKSILTSAGLVPLPPTPGVPVSDLIIFGGDSYGGGISANAAAPSDALGNLQPGPQQYAQQRDEFAQQYRDLQRPNAVPSQENWSAGRIHQVYSGHQCRWRSAGNREFVFHWSVEMVRFLLSGRRRSMVRKRLDRCRSGRVAGRAGRSRQAAQEQRSRQPAPPELLLDGGRKLTL